ncbi:hypothetical protein Daudx_1399 [Candidatus Desulforudis audaxviator]|nr:hypothetical protein Daudx_1399 [Candidatus Desulforudis audaxviator]
MIVLIIAVSECVYTRAAARPAAWRPEKTNAPVGTGAGLV